MIKRTVYVDDPVWTQLKDYYRGNGVGISVIIRKYMETDLRRLTEAGLIEETPLKLSAEDTDTPNQLKETTQ